MCVCVCVDWIFDVLACRDCCVGFMCLLWHVLWFALSVVVVVASGWECQCSRLVRLRKYRAYFKGARFVYIARI